MIEQIVKYHAPKVGMMSLVGILTQYLKPEDYPLSFGNYMGLSDGPYLVNMWAENLEEWAKRNPDVESIEITTLTDGRNYLGFVTDDRLKGWTNDKMCVTGQGWGSRELCEAAHNFLGIPINNSICGCEKLDQEPMISKTFWFNTKNTEYHCHYCNRKWTE